MSPATPPPSPRRLAGASAVTAGVLLLIPFATACSDYLLGNTEEDPIPEPDDDTTPPPDDEGIPCPDLEFPPEEIGPGDACTPDNPSTGISPVVEWEYGGFDGCLSLPTVGDIDGDGAPEVVLNITSLFATPGELVVLRGDGGGEVWRHSTAQLGFGASPTLADLDADGSAEILVVKEYASSLLPFAQGDYTLVAYSAEGSILWESAHFIGADFEYATSPSVSDMDHDGSPEIVVGRAILNADGTTRGVGMYGSGTSGLEGCLSAVADLDLDGVEEVITGNAIYTPDGMHTWQDSSSKDGYVSVANLDEDPEGEFVVVSSDKIHAHDTDGSLLWGPDTYFANSTISPVAIADVDVDGWPELLFAGANQLYAVNHDGSPLWNVPIVDESGATGPSVFDFGGDGRPEVVHIDEVQVLALDGPTGNVVFQSDEHGSNTMFDYPVIADVDGDDEAELVVCHNAYSSAVSVYGDPEGSWVPARPVWNQHAYGITHVNDDLTIPVDAVPSFVASNTWHSGISNPGQALDADLEGEILDVCTHECERGSVWVTVQVRNRGLEAAPAGIAFSLYARKDGGDVLLATGSTSAGIDSGWTSGGIRLEASAQEVAEASALVLKVDDDGTGTGAVEECSETNNLWTGSGSWCGEGG